MSVPTHTSDLSVGKFKTFLTTHGAEVLTETNPYEVVRVSIRGQTSILYKTRQGSLTWDSKLEEAYRCWKTGRSWTGLNGERTKNRVKKRPVMVRTLEERDGPGCWFCGWEPTPDTEEELTLEHLLEISKGGGNHIFNLVLACVTCNSAVQHKSIAEKVQYREALQNKQSKED